MVLHPIKSYGDSLRKSTTWVHRIPDETGEQMSGLTEGRTSGHNPRHAIREAVVMA